MKPIFDASNLCTDICKTIFVILEVQFHHERGLSETRYFELLFSTWSRLSRLSPYQKMGQWVSQWFIVSDLEIASTSPSLASLFWGVSCIWGSVNIMGDIASLLHQDEGGIGKSIPDAQKISRGRCPREISRVEGNLEGRGDFFIPPEFWWSTDILSASIFL